MNFEDLASKCKWRISARCEAHCKACMGQPNGTECKKENCAPYYFAVAIANQFLLDSTPAKISAEHVGGIGIDK